jgi:hypothetical protein
MKLINPIVVTMTLVAQSQSGFLHGTVMDSSGAVVPDVRIEVTSSEGRCEVKSNAEGKFNCQLQAGVYALKASHFNIVPYRRAAIRILPSERKYIVIRPVWVAPSDQNAIRDPELSYESQQIDDMNVLLQFESERSSDDKRVIGGKHTMLTFDDVAVYAGEITCSKPIRRCAAIGGVTVQVGKEQLDGVGVELDFSTRILVVTRDPKVVRTF